MTGTIRTGHFYYKVNSSIATEGGYSLAASMMDGANERKVTYVVKLVDEQLQVGTRRRPDQPMQKVMAVRAPAGEGAYPARLPLPAQHTVPDNGLAKTPPMGWNSWNKFAGRRI